jgi:hypothetical protein
MKKYLFSATFLLLFFLLMPSISSAATYYGDTDGDGYTDTVTTSTTGITVYHPHTGGSNYYSYSSASSFAVNSLKDTDGVAGVEIIVVWIQGGTTSGIDVIHDRTRGTNRYNYGTQAFSIDTVVDTDGVAGNDIIVVWIQGGTTTITGIDVIHDRTGGTTNRYNYGSQGTFTILGVRDYDGIPGAEICYRWVYGSYFGYKKIIDRTYTIVTASGC